MGAAVSEVDHHDDRRDRQPVADDRERPRVAGVALVDEPADGASIQVMRPPRKQRAFPAVRAPLADAAPKRGQDHCTFSSEMSKSSVAFDGIFVGSGDVEP